jgi:hypothetical protein
MPPGGAPATAVEEVGALNSPFDAKRLPQAGGTAVIAARSSYATSNALSASVSFSVRVAGHRLALALAVLSRPHPRSQSVWRIMASAWARSPRLLRSLGNPQRSTRERT